MLKGRKMTKAQKLAHGKRIKAAWAKRKKAAKAGNAGHDTAIAGGLGGQIKARVSALVNEAIDAEINRILSE